MNRNGKGIVYLVGAGPGDPDLITVRAREVLSECDAVVFDSLIPGELLVTLPVGADKRYVGKQSGHHSVPQEEINDMLVRLALRGKRVVRLKGGDPFVFGRGAEEASYLKEHGIPYEIVPGITSGVAALSYAGIPCTDRSSSSYVMFLTGHQAVEKATSGVPWDWVAGARNGTLVIYMGVSEIPRIVDQLIGAGMPPDTPAAAIERGTVPTQRTLSTTLAQLPARAAKERIRPPALFVLGSVAEYHQTLDWFGDRPLFGLRVMVTRPADQAQPLYRELRRAGAEVLAYPTIATAEEHRAEQWGVFRKNTVGDRWLVFTNQNGVRYFMSQWCATIGDIRDLGRYRVAAVGHGTVDALKERHIRPDFVPAHALPSALAWQMAQRLPLTGATVVRVTGSSGNDVVERGLRATGADVHTLPVYRTFPIEWLASMKSNLFAYPPDVVLFTSRAAVDGLARNLDGGEIDEVCGRADVVSIGPATSAAIRSQGMKVAFESRFRSASSIVDELVTHYRAKACAEAV